MLARIAHALCGIGVVAVVAAAQDFADVTIERTKIAEGIYFLAGAGGNLVVSVGEDGAFLIDDQFAPLTEKIETNIREMTDGPVRFIVNTHFHGDHTGGNEAWGERGTILVAHDNVRERLMSEQYIEALDRTMAPQSKAGWPVITFAEDLTFHYNGDEIHVFHVGGAHTDGDAIVHFRGANVVHVGDVMFNGLYPLIDYSNGGSIHGVIAAVERVRGMIDDDTVIVPGHGEITDRKGLDAYHAMLIAVRDAIQPLLDEGKSIEDIVAAKPTAAWDETWGAGLFTPDQFVAIAARGMTGR